MLLLEKCGARPSLLAMARRCYLRSYPGLKALQRWSLVLYQGTTLVGPSKMKRVLGFSPCHLYRAFSRPLVTDLSHQPLAGEENDSRPRALSQERQARQDCLRYNGAGGP